MPIKNTQLVDEWFKNAENALGYARTGLPDTTFYSWICFLCHQSAELYLKGFLMFHHQKPPKVHDLTKLLELSLEFEDSLKNLLPACKILNHHYIATRYPPNFPSADKNDAREAVRLASKVEKLIVKLRKSE